MLDGEAAALELADERAKELMPTAGGWRLEVVEQREVGAIATGATPVRLRAQASGNRTARPSHRPRKRAGVHEATR